MKTENRLLSLDFFRGVTMFLLVGEWTGIFNIFSNPEFNDSLIYALNNQFHHHPWNGLRFWDLVQPFFMFIVGVAIPFSVKNRIQKGSTNSQLLKHAVKRSLILLLLGWALYCIGPGRITFRFQNVLAQLSVTYLIAFLIRNKSFAWQLIFSFVLIGLTEVLYRTFPVDGFNEAFEPAKNFGAWFDLLISGELSGGHWVSFNAIPTTANTIWGVLVGKLLLQQNSPIQKLKWLVVAGLLGILVGYALDPITPIVKRICTSSFVIVSGGWTILTFAICYWLIDIKKNKIFCVIFCNSRNESFIHLFIFTHWWR